MKSRVGGNQFNEVVVIDGTSKSPRNSHKIGIPEESTRGGL